MRTDASGSDRGAAAPAAETIPFRHLGRTLRLERRTSADGTTSVTVLPDPHARQLPAELLRGAVDEARRIGGPDTVVLSPAITAEEAVGFTTIGFTPVSHLHLLVHDLAHLTFPARRARADASRHGIVVRDADPTDDDAALAVDRLAFRPEWAMDALGLANARRATPAARYRVAADRTGHVVGYAVTGRAGRRGYLQRLAVHPDCQGRGVGRTLVLDGLRWCRRWGTRGVVVNTQHGNERALGLYRGLGFRDTTVGLVVLELRPTTSAGA